MTNLIYPGGRTVTYFYDNLNRMTNVMDWSGRKTAITYDLDSRIKSITLPNGTYRTIGYDAAGQATNILEQMANSLPIAIFKYNWTNSGSMAWEFAAPLPHSATVPTRTMTYDNDNRLATFKLGTTDTLTVGSDADGNLTNAPLMTNALVAYTYDARNRLLNAGGVTNSYDAINNRIGQTSGTNIITYVVNPNAKLSQVLIRIKNNVTNYYIYGPGLLYQITETATATNTLTYHYDYRGSTVALSADNGLVTDRIEYSAYGLTTYRIGTSDTPFLFNGRYGVMTDPNGLLYMRARYYNPYLCRFLNPDPTGFKGGLNFYAFANGNPVSYIDPTGMGAVGDNNNLASWLNGSGGTPMNLGDPFGLNGTTTGDSQWNWAPNAPSVEQQAMDSMRLVTAGIDFHPGVYQPTEPSTFSIFMLGATIAVPALQTQAYMDEAKAIEGLQAASKALTEAELNVQMVRQDLGLLANRVSANSVEWQAARAVESIRADQYGQAFANFISAQGTYFQAVSRTMSLSGF